MTEIAIAILVGGESRRMGRDKARLELDGETLLARTIRVARASGDRVLVVGRRPEELPDDVRARCVPDRSPGRGPMGGLRTALAELKCPVLGVACDMPDLDRDAFDWATDVPEPLDADAIVTERDGRVEPLFSVYSPSLVPELDSRLEAGELGLCDLLESVDTVRRTLPEALADRLADADTPEEWRRLQSSTRTGS